MYIQTTVAPQFVAAQLVEAARPIAGFMVVEKKAKWVNINQQMSPGLSQKFI